MNKKLRIAIDSGMVLLLPLLMVYSLLGETVHEYLGIGMSLLFVAHHILNIAWWKAWSLIDYLLVSILFIVLGYVCTYLIRLKHIQAVYQWQVRSMHSLIRVWFFNTFLLPNRQCGAYSQQRCKHQCCFCGDCILQISFSSYLIFLSFNQSFVTKIRSISISSPCHFYFVL